MAQLPIDDALPALIDALRHHPSALLRAPTGAGKTTRVPLALLRAGLAGDRGLILMTQPRRLAARAAARWMAQALGEEVGETVGYNVRLDRRAGPRTRVLVVTEGVLLRMLQQDPFLEAVNLLIFDEIHERSLTLDTALALARKVQQEARDDLRLLAMSATLDPGPLQRFLEPCAAVESLGRLHPVTVEHARTSPDTPLEARVRDAVLHLLPQTPGDLLVFLPGMAEIRRAIDALRDARLDADLRPLHGSLTAQEQDAALRAGPRRRVVLATNVAETSVTVDGVTAVIDSGLARTLRHSPATGLDRLELGMISRDAAEQRAGRAGRQQPGRCLRLWSEHRHLTLPDRTPPEILRADLAAVALQLLAWGERDLLAFPWFEPPPPGAVQRALDLLRLLGLLDERGLTPLGRDAADLPLHPRLAALLIAGHRLGHPQLAARAAALLADRDPFEDLPGHHPEPCDLLPALDALDAWARRLPHRPQADPARVRFTLESADLLEADARKRLGAAPPPALSRRDALARALLAGWPDRVALPRAPQDPRALLVGGRGVTLHPTSRARGAALWLALDLDDAHRPDALVRRATALLPEWLDPQHLTTTRDLDFDPDARRVHARERRRYLDLTLRERTAPLDDPHAAALLLAQHAAPLLHEALDLQSPERAAFLARARFAHPPLPHLLPPLDDAHLTDLLPTLCLGARSFDDLHRLDLPQALLDALPYPARQALERVAPERLTVPSGSAIRLAYDPDDPARPPVLAVRIQEIFGLQTTPAVAEGRVPVLLHLLAPNMRPQQVTQDLHSFWRNTWPEVRKELRQRYPKHAWPDDPLSATPERRSGRKKT